MNTEIRYAGEESYPGDRGRVLFSRELGGWLVPEQARPADWQQRTQAKPDAPPPPPRDWAAERHAAPQITRAPHSPGAGRRTRFTKEELKAHKADWQRAMRAQKKAAKPARLCAACGADISDRVPHAKKCRGCTKARPHHKASAGQEAK